MGVPAVLAALGKVCTSPFIFKTIMLISNIKCHPWSVPSLPASHHFHKIGYSEVAETKNDLSELFLGPPFINQGATNSWQPHIFGASTPLPLLHSPANEGS